MMRKNNILVLDAEDAHHFTFVFRGKRWSLYTLVIAIAVLVGTLAVSHQSHIRHRDLLVPGGYVAVCLFLWSSFYSYFARRVLEIDGYGKVIKYYASSVFGKKEWIKGFAEFEDVRIWRPERESFLVIILRMINRQEIPLGTSEAGIFGLDKAQKIAQSIATMMNIPLVVENTARNRL